MKIDKEIIKKVENKTLPAHTYYIVKTLKEKRLYHLVDAYIELSHHLKRQEYSYIKRDLHFTKALKLRDKIIKYCVKYDVEYKDKPKIDRKKEDAEKVAIRQKKFIEKQKTMKKKKVQVFISSNSYERLLNMALYKGVNQSEIIERCLLLGSQHWDK